MDFPKKRFVVTHDRKKVPVVKLLLTVKKEGFKGRRLIE